MFTLDADLSDDANLEPSKSVISLFEEWDWRERQSKAIRSNYLYEYFGYQFWFPFKDHEYMDFCRNLPLKYRQGKALHEEYVEQQYREATSEVIVKPGFLTVPKWLWFVNRTVGRLPVVDKLARQLYRRICKSDFEYDPQFGMLSEDELETIIHKLVTDEADLGGLTARRIHALNLSEEYDIEVDDKERHGDYFYNLN